MVIRQWARRVWTLLFVVLLTHPVYSQDLSLSQHLTALAEQAKIGVEAAKQEDVAVMQAQYTKIHEEWATFEDQVRDRDASSYVELEIALDQVRDAVATAPIQTNAAQNAYESFIHKVDETVVRFAVDAPAENIQQAAITPATPEQALILLEETQTALASKDVKAAKMALTQVITLWPSIEGTVATKSKAAYTAIEGDLGQAAAALKAQPVNFEAAEQAVERLHTTLAPFSQIQTYGMFDASVILFREGLEALLVVVALLAFLRRSNNGDKSKWIWIGAGAGLIVSMGVAFILQTIFNRVSAGQNREFIEGITGLVAAGLLLYVSYWLHSKSSLYAWQKYINHQTTQALAKGSLFGLALLSFLAVFREGAETAIFYLGMAPSISRTDLLLGLGVGILALVVIAILILVVGVRLPIRTFFRVAGLLVYYLGFKFVGTGIHALQVSGVLPTTQTPFLREISVLGIFPTWETLLPQLVLLVGAISVFLYLQSRDRQTQITSAASI